MNDNLDPELIRTLNELSETVANMVPAMVLMTAAMKDNLTESKISQRFQNSQKKAVEDFLKAQVEATAATQARAKADRDKAAWDANVKIASDLASDSLTKFGKNLLSAGGGMTKYTGALDGAGKATSSITKNFEGLGGTVGKVAGGLGLFAQGIITAVKLVLTQNDNMLKAADALSTVGVNGTITAKEIMQLGQASGYSSSELEKWTTITKDLGNDLTALGVGATQGAQAFAKLTTMDERLLERYSALGVTQEQLNKNQADYIKLQARSGLEINERMKQDGSLRRATLEYTGYLQDLAALTGTDVDELKKRQQVAQSDLAFSTRMSILQEKEETYRKTALNAKTADERAEATMQADKLKREREASKGLLDVATAAGVQGDELAGITSALATGNWNELSAGFATAAPDMLSFMKAVKEGKREPYEFAKFLSDATERTRRTVGESITQSKELGKAYAYSAEMVQLNARFRGKSDKEINDELMKNQRYREWVLKNGTDDQQKAARAAQETTERRVRLGADAIVGLLNGPVTSAFEKLMKAIGWLAKGLAKLAGWALDNKQIEEMFDTPDDIAEKIAKVSERAIKSTAGRDSAQLAKDDPAKYRALVAQEEKTSKAEVTNKLDAWREAKKQADEEQDVTEKVIKLKKADALASELSQAQVKAADKEQEARRIRQMNDTQLRNDAQRKLLSLEQKRVEILEEEQRLELRKLENEIKLGKFTGDALKTALERLEMLKKITSGTDTNAPITGSTAGSAVSQAIGGAESGGSYDVAFGDRDNGGRITNTRGLTTSETFGGKKLSEMTLAEVMKFQEQRNKESAGSGAVGKYQFMPSTLFGKGGLVSQAGLGMDAKFDANTQEKLQELLLKQNRDQLTKSGIKDTAGNLYMAHYVGAGGAQSVHSAIKSGENISVADALTRNSKDPVKAKENLLRQNPELDQIRVSEFERILESRVAKNTKQDTQQSTVPAEPKAALGGLFEGPTTGYPVTLHGSEWVVPDFKMESFIQAIAETKKISLESAVPTPNSTAATSPVNSNTTIEMTGLEELTELFGSKLDAIIDKLSSGNDIQGELLKYSRV